jgi:hypothetical protein
MAVAVFLTEVCMRAASFIIVLLFIVVVGLALRTLQAQANGRMPVVAGETSGPYNPDEPDGRGRGA